MRAIPFRDAIVQIVDRPTLSELSDAMRVDILAALEKTYEESFTAERSGCLWIEAGHMAPAVDRLLVALAAPDKWSVISESRLHFVNMARIRRATTIGFLAIITNNGRVGSARERSEAHLFLHSDAWEVLERIEKEAFAT